jgi:membrane-associated phospholipid phosphatase
MPACTRALKLLALAVLSLSVAPALYAQTQAKRLSDWLIAQPRTADDYPLGLSWQVPDEIPAQHAILLDLIGSLAALERSDRNVAELARRLRHWLRTLPITGRVPVSLADPRWLQANPARDPILLPGHSVVLPRRPRTVTVVTEVGELCRVLHSQGHEAKPYLEACERAGAGKADWAWIAQPDGRVQRFGVASWNRETQDEPAPGAWIWAPSRASAWPERVSQKLIEFLATQGPAPDAHDATPGNTRRDTGGRFSDLPALGAAAVKPGTVPKTAPRTSGRSRSLEVTASDWGGVGLLQTPTARMAEPGHFSFNVSRTTPYTHGNVFAQPLEWFGAGFRYTNISNRLYSLDLNFSGDQAYKDKGVDFKFRLWSESAYVPEVALGFRDLSGTGLFAGEYLVASKRTGPVDWSLGLGWGYVGGRGNLRNPLARIRPAFETRAGTGGVTGKFNVATYFHGPTALFGGLQYQSPWEPLIVKLEYDGNNYQREPFDNNQKQSSPLNFGLVYRASNWVDVSAAIERGNTFMFGLALHSPLNRLSTPKLNDPPRVPVAPVRPQRAPDWSSTSKEIERQTDWHVARIEERARELRVTVEDAGALHRRDRLDKAVAVLHRDAPASVDRFTFVSRLAGVEITENVVDRDAWVDERIRPLPPRERREAVFARAPEPAARRAALYESASPLFDYGFGPAYKHVMGGPDGFIMYQIGLGGGAKLRLREDTWLQGAVQLGLLSNFDRYRNRGTSDLPRVRTFLREYFVTSQFNMPNLQLMHVGKLSENQYYSLYGGYLEYMFAGIGGEWLYRPHGSRVAVGVDVNGVQQRGFRQDFELRDYRAGTGHATLYWDTGWNDVHANLSFGRYLAGDIGATVQLTRVFKNGVAIGAFFSRTNVSAAQFGEGSFDKGVFVNVPFDAFLTKSSNASANFLWRPLTRDGAAKLERSGALYDITSARSNRALDFAPAPPPNKELIPADRRESWTPKPEGPAPYTRIVPKTPVEHWVADARLEQRLFEALYVQGFRNIRIAFDQARRLTVHASNEEIRPASRAVGRAARTALRLAPLEAREIRVVFMEQDAPAVSYDFVDLDKLDAYFDGALSHAEIAKTIFVEFINPTARVDDPLAQLGDLDTKRYEPTLVDVLTPDTRVVSRVGRDFAGAARMAASADWLRAGALGMGLVASSSVFDRRVDRYVRDLADSRWRDAGVRFGNAIPWIAMGGAALAAFDASNPVRSRTGFAAAEAGVTAYLAATGFKYAVGRARPGVEGGGAKPKPFSGTDPYDAFPSRHTSVAWAAITPFAVEYDAPWLYGIAAIANLGRIGSREHWLSDTVAGSLLGYGIGRLFLESARGPKGSGPRVELHPSGVNLAWQFD